MNESYISSNNYCSTSSNTNGTRIKQEFKRSSPFAPGLNSKHIKTETSQTSTVRVKEEPTSQNMSNSSPNIVVKEEEMAEDIAERSFLFGEISSSGNIKVKEEEGEGVESNNNGQVNQNENSNTNNKNENIKQEEEDNEEEDPFDEMSLLDDLSFLEEEFNQLGTPSQVLNSKTYLRLTILEKTTENFLNASNYWEPQIKLNCLHRQSEQGVTIFLRGSWMQTPIKIGENVNLIGQLNFDNECIVNDQENLFILNPDLLINSTQIASSYNCLRSSILQNKSMIVGSYTKPLIIGTFLHDLLEVCLNSNNFDDSFMALQLERLVRENGDQLYSANLTEEEIMEDLNLGKQKLQSWSKKYVSETLKPNKFSKTSHKFENSMEEPSEFRVNLVTKVWD
ncbi:Dna2-domain-containing protein [Conidiobolus coronatus NRRL 28638]|uniref:Dna2-domain-containing protein n=1 Tax=Conidiobolus coronatus (strain ATCC 28846 / CBS 209.66 / NRRL 28638) TaxID=796925 RepID=A0A137P369_CONC2|nr:Dna2-domain-containing protein [Conidiobolus coronatus NRRL 28638]|eukprot:KXN69463.1 Dna2-domain-containing protein [Conidiobolus coronatus NRRL 28638]